MQTGINIGGDAANRRPVAAVPDLRAATVAALPSFIATGARRAVTAFGLGNLVSFPVYQQFVHDSCGLFVLPGDRLRGRMHAMLQDSLRLVDAQTLFATHSLSLGFDVAHAIDLAERRVLAWNGLAPMSRLALCIMLAQQRIVMARSLGRIARRGELPVVDMWVRWHLAQARQQKAVCAALWRAQAARTNPAVAQTAWRRGWSAAMLLSLDRIGEGDAMLARHGYGLNTRAAFALPALATGVQALVRLAPLRRPPRAPWPTAVRAAPPQLPVQEAASPSA